MPLEEIAMHKIRCTKHQTIANFEYVEASRTVIDVCYDTAISEVSNYNWKAKHCGMDASDIKNLKDLEDENWRFKQIFPDLSLESHALKDVIENDFKTSDET